MKRYAFIFIIFIIVIVSGLVIKTGTVEFLSQPKVKPVPDSILFSSAPVLTPAQALHTFRLPEDFAIELVASEPLVQDPVAMSFDARGRIWVVEMRGYMHDVTGSGENEASGRIVILEDQDDDGIMDHAKVFLDGLVMPRAISVRSDGILYAEPPNLWFVENINDKPGKKVLVDSTYAAGGNPEHKANGLMRGIDNWYYSAKSNVRYKYTDNKWIREKTEFRGQWGITKDNYGRLFYNTNSNQLRGDLVPPNMLNRNVNFKPTGGINVEIAANQNVYPIRPTPGVNRGYKEGVLNEALKLRQFTAACGPLIYRGDNFPGTFVGNAFVCEPAGNLVKRNILTENGPYIEAQQAYPDREFLASTDERFRPVNLFNAPDGSLYVLDMYRGVIQHETYLTDYLKQEIKRRDLEKPIGYGRIYRIVYKGNWWDNLIRWMYNPGVDLDNASGEKLVSFLTHRNGWWRDNAQRLLVERRDAAVIPDMIALLKSKRTKSVGKIHVLWALEGMEALSADIIRLALRSEDPKVVATVIRVAERMSESDDAREVLEMYENVMVHKAPAVQLQLALSLGEFMDVDPAAVMNMLRTIAVGFGDDPLIRTAILSSIEGKALEFLELLKQAPAVDPSLLTMARDVADRVIAGVKTKAENLPPAAVKRYISGKKLYGKTCSGCHGDHGEGLVPIAPPLAGSEWVTGPEGRLTLIVLHGLKGPVTVNGKTYKVPEVQPVMPGLKHNRQFSDEKIASLLTYIRNAWNNEAGAVNETTIRNIRKRSADRKEPFTAKELVN